VSRRTDEHSNLKIVDYDTMLYAHDQVLLEELWAIAQQMNIIAYNKNTNLLALKLNVWE